MPSPYAVINVQPPPRVAESSQQNLTFRAQSSTLTTAWGAQPATAEIVYIPPTDDWVPVAAGSMLRIELMGHLFYGICDSDNASVSTGGKTRTMAYSDLRKFLTFDQVRCAFNLGEKRLVGARWVKRYRHLLPRDVQRGIWTYSAEPYTAAQILDFLFGSPTVHSPWARVYHSDQVDLPVYGIDCLGGRDLCSVIQEVSDKQGLLFGLISSDSQPYRLVWIRKGFGVLPVYDTATIYPARSMDQRHGTALSGNATRVEVVGGRNLYEVLNLEMTHDWNRNWEDFFDLSLFILDLFNRCNHPETGEPLNALSDDIEHQTGWQFAAARAREMTVAEYAALRTDRDYTDHRLFAGRSRMTMPVAVYLQSILFRAFRPPTIIPIRHGVPLKSLRISSQMVAQVTHDVKTGVMTALYDQLVTGNGYAIAQGYTIGRDAFRTIQPERFNINDWLSQQDAWQAITFQIDDAGEDGGFILFEEPVIRSQDLLKAIDGYASVNANPTFALPAVRAALVFEAEIFSYTDGFPPRARTENVAELNAEFVVEGGNITEIPFDDGRYAWEKAAEIAESLLLHQYSYAQGGFTRAMIPGDAPISINSMYDRVQVSFSPDGIYERVDFTSERVTNSFTPERDFDRRLRERALLPGQEELQAQARTHRMIGQGLKQNPDFAAFLAAAVMGEFGSIPDVTPTVVKSSEEATSRLKMGTPLFKKPTKTRSGIPKGNYETQAVHPNEVTSAHTELAGITVRDGEDPSAPLNTQRKGPALCRVQGPVNVGDTVGGPVNAPTVPGLFTANIEEYDPESLGHDYLAKSGVGGLNLSVLAPNRAAVARVMEAITEDKIQLIRVQILDPAQPAEKFLQVQVIEEGDDVLRCYLRGAYIIVAKPPALRRNRWESGSSQVGDGRFYWYGEGLTQGQVRFTYLTPNDRIAIHTQGEGEVNERQVIVPPYYLEPVTDGTQIPPRFIYVQWVDDPLFNVDPETLATGSNYPVHYLDVNADARRWEKLTQTQYREAVEDNVVKDSDGEI